MTRLERRYRLLLRMLPGWYRAEREEEMVATFLADRDDELDLEYGWPGWREAWAVAVLAVRARQSADAPPRTATIGNALRLVALGGLLAETTVAAGALIFMLAVPDPGPPRYPYPWWLQAHLAGALAIIAAFVLVTTGARTAAKALAAVAVLPGLLGLGTWNEPWSMIGPIVAMYAPLWVPVGCLFAGFHRAAPASRPRPWLVAGAAGAAAGLAWVGLPYLVTGDWQTTLAVFEPGALRAWALLVGAGLYLRLRRRDRSGSVALAFAIGLAVLLAERLSYLAFTVQYRQATHDWVPLVVTAVQVALLMAVGAVLAAVAARRLRRTAASLAPA
jgi:hypothetical protein